MMEEQNWGRDVWHVRWRYQNRRGLIGVEYNKYDRTITVAPLTPSPPPAGILWNAFDATLGQGWAEKLEKKHRERQRPWLVECKHRTSGARDYLLRILVNETVLDQPVIARLHVSASGNLSEAFTMVLGNLAPLLAYARKEGGIEPLELGPEDYVRAYEAPHWGGEFNAPGKSSGLLEVLEADAALRSLSS